MGLKIIRINLKESIMDQIHTLKYAERDMNLQASFQLPFEALQDEEGAVYLHKT
jgi:hypothetical protein